jgi:HPt (histidine-containing phosphotransfer) domain-containing protein
LGEQTGCVFASEAKLNAVFTLLNESRGGRGRLSALLISLRYQAGMVADTRSFDHPLFDAAHLRRYTDGDAALTRELLELMCEQARRCIGLMAEARDVSQWRTATHTLKGAARGVGAFALAEVCDLAEEQPQLAWDGARLEIERCFSETEAAFSGVL